MINLYWIKIWSIYYGEKIKTWIKSVKIACIHIVQKTTINDYFYSLTYFFSNLDRSVGESDALAEAFGPTCHSTISGDTDVVSMDLVEEQGWQVVGAHSPS